MPNQERQPEKKPYAKPQVVEYGGLTQITQAMKSGMKPDNNSTPGMNRSL